MNKGEKTIYSRPNRVENEYESSDRSIFPAGKGSQILRGIPWRFRLLVEGIHVEIWVVSETRILADIQGSFQIGVKIRGKFPQTCKHFNSLKNDIKSSLGYFHITGTLPMLLYCILKFLGKHKANFHVEISPGIPWERRQKYPHRTFPFISPKYPQGNYAEISTGMIPMNSPKNPCGNLGDVDGLPAGFKSA